MFASHPLFLLHQPLQLPIVKIPGLKDLQRIYFCFGEPIRCVMLLLCVSSECWSECLQPLVCRTEAYGRDWENIKSVEEVRDKTKLSVESGIRFLQHVQVCVCVCVRFLCVLTVRLYLIGFQPRSCSCYLLLALLCRHEPV